MPWSPNGADISDKKKAQMLLTFLNTYKDDLVGGTNKKFVTDLLKFIVSSLVATKEPRYISVEANKKIGAKSLKQKEVYKKDPEKVLRIEHTIPTKEVVNYVLKDVLGNSRKMNESFLKSFFEKISGFALITREEDKKLSARKLGAKLPSDTSIDDILKDASLHSCRYKSAEIDVINLHRE